MELDQVPYKLIISILVIAIIVGLVVNVTYFTPKYKRVDEGFLVELHVDQVIPIVSGLFLKDHNY